MAVIISKTDWVARVHLRTFGFYTRLFCLSFFFFPATAGEGGVWKLNKEVAAERKDQEIPRQEDLLRRAGSLRQEANQFVVEGSNEAAIAAYDQALALFEAAGSRLEQAEIFLRKSDAFLQSGDHALAMAMGDRALAIYAESGAIKGQGDSLLTKGLICIRSGDNESAMKLFDQALGLLEKSENHRGQAQVWLARGDYYFSKRDYDRAVAMYTAALPLFDKADFPLGQGNVWRSIANIRFVTRDYPSSREMLDRAMPYFEKGQSLMGQGLVWRARGDICFETGDLDGALDMYDRALALHERLGAPESVAYSMLNKAKVLCRLGKTAEVGSLVESTIYRMEIVRTHSRQPDLKKKFLEKIYRRYEEAVHLFLEHGLSEQGFRIVEAMKARGFLDQLSAGKGTSAASREEKYVGQLESLYREYAGLSRALAKSTAEGSAPKPEQLAEQRKSVEAEMNRLEEAIRLQSPRFASVHYPQPVAVSELRNQVLQPGEVLVEFFLSEKASYVFLIRREGIEAQKINRTKADLENDGERFLELIRTRRSTTETGKRLYDALFSPWEGSLRQGSTLILVPDGILSRIPLEAIPAGIRKGHTVYLAETRNIRYIQSASILALLRRFGKEMAPEGTFVGFGDPAYSPGMSPAGDVRSRSVTPEAGPDSPFVRESRWQAQMGSLPRLPATANEIRAIGQIFRSGKNPPPRIFLQDAATEKAAKAPEMKNYRYVHFACHGLRDGENQALALTRRPGDDEDGFLELPEFMHLDWNARLVVLSACETGKGKIEPGEGVTGLTRAVMYAGTPAVLVSLWEVSDESTMDLMKHFYYFLVKKKFPPSESLRRAKLRLQKQGLLHPFFWGGFVLYGE